MIQRGQLPCLEPFGSTMKREEARKEERMITKKNKII